MVSAESVSGVSLRCCITYMVRDKDRQGPHIRKDAHAVDRGHNRIDLVKPTLSQMLHASRNIPYRFALEWPAYNCAISQCILCDTAAWNHPALRDVESIEDDNNVELSSAGSFNIFQKPGCKILLGTGTKEGRMQGDCAF